MNESVERIDRSRVSGRERRERESVFFEWGGRVRQLHLRSLSRQSRWWRRAGAGGEEIEIGGRRDPNRKYNFLNTLSLSPSTSFDSKQLLLHFRTSNQLHL